MTIRPHRTRTRLSLATPLALALLSGLAHGAHGLKDEAPGTSLTIYSTAVPGAIPASMYRPVPQSLQTFANMSMYNPYQGYYGMPPGLPGYAVVRQDRTINLKDGRSTISFSDVAALLDPTTVTFTSLTAPAETKVVEQSYQFDLVSPQKMLERFTGQSVVLDGKEVTLLSASAGSGVLVKDADGSVRWQNGYGAISFPGMADGLITQPTLIWDLFTTKPGDHRARVSYQTEGVTWWADYNVIFAEGKDQNSGTLDVNAWVSILNQSGADYKNASLKLVAGDVHRAPQGGQGGILGGARRELAMADAAPAGFEEKSFFEYHLYTLGRPTTIPQASTKQIELFDAPRGVPCEKVLVYYGIDQNWRPYWSSPATDRDIGVPSNTKVDVYLSFKNTKENGMGMPLPSGRVRVSKGRSRRRLDGVHWRGRHRPHRQGRDRPPQTRQLVRRGRRTYQQGLPDRRVTGVDGRDDPGHVAEPQGRAREGHHPRDHVSLEAVGGCAVLAPVREAGFRHHPRPHHPQAR
jgi:hypothetical protein